MRLRTGYTILVQHPHHYHHSIRSTADSVYSDLSDDEGLLVDDVVDPLLLGLSSRRSTRRRREIAVASATSNSSSHAAVDNHHEDEQPPMRTQLITSTSSEINLLLDENGKTGSSTCHNQEIEHRNDKNEDFDEHRICPNREPLYSDMVVSIPLDEDYDGQGDSLVSLHKLSCLLEGTQMDGNSTLGTSITSVISSLHRSNTSLLPAVFQPVHRRPHMHRRVSCTALPNVDEVLSGSIFRPSPPCFEDTSVSMDTSAAAVTYTPDPIPQVSPSTPHLLHFSSSLLDSEPPLFWSHTLEDAAPSTASSPRHHRRNPMLLG